MRVLASMQTFKNSEETSITAVFVISFPPKNQSIVFEREKIFLFLGSGAAIVSFNFIHTKRRVNFSGTIERTIVAVLCLLQTFMNFQHGDKHNFSFQIGSNPPISYFQNSVKSKMNHLNKMKDFFVFVCQLDLFFFWATFFVENLLT